MTGFARLKKRSVLVHACVIMMACPAVADGGLTDLFRTVFPGFSGPQDEGAPRGLESEAYDLMAPGELLTQQQVKNGRPWRPPDYSHQEGALGWGPQVFATLPGLEGRVQFWFDIYTKFTSNQGLLHDRDHLGVVFEVVDFSSIMADKSKNIYQKAMAREKLVNERRELISQRLEKLSSISSPNSLDGEDLRLWKLYESVNEPDKLKNASQKKRIRFQLGQRDRFALGIYFSGRYLRQMEQIFRDERLPVELTRLPFVESSFNIMARSRVGASGIWQFMPRSARPFLRVGRDVDERNDPIKATRASAKMLRQNYQLLKNWPLAITAYNHGPTGVKKIVDKVGTRELVQLIESNDSQSFGFASANFYACFIAALSAEREARRNYGEVLWGPEIETPEIRLKRPMSFGQLVDFFDGDADSAEIYNSHLTSRVRKGKNPIPANSYIRVPKPRVTLAEDFARGKLGKDRLPALLKTTPMIPRPAVLLEPETDPRPAISESHAEMPESKSK